MNIKAIVIDDEKMARSLLQGMIEEFCKEVVVVAVCEDLPNGVKAIRKHKPDLVFLDIEMPGHSGLELLDFFNEDEVNFSIIFTTAYNNYAIQAFKLSAVDYLLKPIESEELEKSIELYKKNRGKKDYSILKNNLQNSSQHLMAVHTLSSIKFIEIESIIYLKADGAYTHIYQNNNTHFTASKSLKHFEDLLITNTLFFRCHKSYIANLKYVNEYIKSDGGYLLLQGKHEINVSPDKSSELLQLMGKL